ncbi:hypothetical protein HDU84_007845 [Entophlyctis sp. JEL0112]|nr:hypothetical protein HDU84_007845 [Entophlyctis sp. JEL0112]
MDGGVPSSTAPRPAVPVSRDAPAIAAQSKYSFTRLTLLDIREFEALHNDYAAKRLRLLQPQRASSCHHPQLQQHPQQQQERQQQQQQQQNQHHRHQQPLVRTATKRPSDTLSPPPPAVAPAAAPASAINEIPASKKIKLGRLEKHDFIFGKQPGDVISDAEFEESAASSDDGDDAPAAISTSAQVLVTQQPPKKKSRNTRYFALSPELQTIIGTSDPVCYRDVKKLAMAYIKKNSLQHPFDKRFIVCDDNLMIISGQKTLPLFNLYSTFLPHMHEVATSFYSENEPYSSKFLRQDSPTSVTSNQTPSMTAAGSESQPVEITHALAEFLGHEGPLPRSEITTRICNYIQKNGLLKEAYGRRVVLCDVPLKSLFGCNTMDIASVPQAVDSHLRLFHALNSSADTGVKMEPCEI